MRSSAARQTPFDEGATSVKDRDDVPNPFTEGSVEYKNFELGRAHGIRSRRNGARADYLGQRAASVAA